MVEGERGGPLRKARFGGYSSLCQLIIFLISK
jgi:hypothetical protein